MIDQPLPESPSELSPDEALIARADLEVARRDHDHMLAAVAAHLRQPLLSIVGFADLVSERAAGSLDPEARDHLERLRSNADVLARQLDALDVLAATRSLLAEGGDDDGESADLEAVATAAALATRHVAPRVRVTVGRLPQVRLPYRLAAELLERLLDNCVRHAGPRCQVTIDTLVGEGGLAVTVGDDGPGIPATERERILEVFQRGSSGQPGGLGVGLAVVAHVMALAGGTVAVSASAAGGCRIELWFPPDRVVGWEPTS